MKRRRVTLPNMPHHVVQRGNRRQLVFFRKEDRLYYLACLRNTCQAFGVDVLGWCLMPNHVHLIMVPRDEGGITRVMAASNRAHAIFVNQAQGWTGCLWQSRFHSFVMSDEHFAVAMRYVELNPVRAGLCKEPGDYPWSSAWAREAGCLDVLVRESARGRLVGRGIGGAVSEQDVARLRECTRLEKPFGDESFLGLVERASGVSWTRPRGRPRRDDSLGVVR